MYRRTRRRRGQLRSGVYHGRRTRSSRRGYKVSRGGIRL